MQLQQIEQKFLQFQLEEGERALINAAIAPEIRLVEANDILPVPQLPEWALGVYAWRDEMLWLVDLSCLLGFSSLVWDGKNYAIVVEIEKRAIGLVVSGVQGIEDRDLQQLQTPSEDVFSPRLMPFLAGYFLEADCKILKLLNPKTIFLACLQNLN
jgi:positive phototaxis protein PixI